jgi:hypothetical protein
MSRRRNAQVPSGAAYFVVPSTAEEEDNLGELLKIVKIPLGQSVRSGSSGAGRRGKSSDGVNP